MRHLRPCWHGQGAQLLVRYRHHFWAIKPPRGQLRCAAAAALQRWCPRHKQGLGGAQGLWSCLIKPWSAGLGPKPRRGSCRHLPDRQACIDRGVELALARQSLCGNEAA